MADRVLGENFERMKRTAAEGEQAADIERAIDTIIASLRSGGTLYACGNGGSDAHAGHLVAELVGRFAYDRPPLRAVHLSSGGPVGSCIANDYGWDLVFQRQVLALCERPWGREDDETPYHVLVCFTTSGRSRNVLEAAHCAWQHGADVVVLTGPGALAFGAIEAEERVVKVRSTATTTPAIQEEHQRLVHEIARRVEEAMWPR